MITFGMSILRFLVSSTAQLLFCFKLYYQNVHVVLLILNSDLFDHEFWLTLLVL